jgi:predicted RNA-binding Zn ribbon-like protein
MDLPSDLSLPLERGAPWWYWLGGRPALDFVNTRRERWWRDVETLVTPDDLSEWVVRAGLLADAPPVDAALLAAARDLREAIDAAALALGEPDGPPDEALAVIDSWLAEASVPDRLRAGEQKRPVLAPGTPAHPGRHALGLLARDAAEMLGTEQRDRVRVCASETCSARFYDRSRGGRRRWCSMQACGNVAKARRHRARQGTDTGPGAEPVP